MLNYSNRKVVNFYSGPSQLPLEVLEEIQQKLIDYKQTGMSIMEMSHRNKYYMDVHDEAISLLRELLSIPDNYKVILLQGGARLQFGMVPMNFLHKSKAAGYVMTDVWSIEAMNEATVIGETYSIGSKQVPSSSIPHISEQDILKNTAYIHITSNNTVAGTQYHQYPNLGDVPLIADMTSDLLSKSIDVNQFGLIYASGQKNLGIAGVTAIIVNENMLERESENVPNCLRYSKYAESNSMLCTPPTFSIYVMSLVEKWIKKQGGIQVIEKRNLEKASLLYNVIDNSNGFYEGYSHKNCRSIMNIVFKLKNKEMDNKFILEAEKEGFIGINGHHKRGGCRVSLYNSISIDNCLDFKEFMMEFKRKNNQ